METSAVQFLKLALVSATGLSKDALHIYVGLGTYLLASLCLRKRANSIAPLLIVIAIACLGELLDMRDDFQSLGYWRWSASLHDLINTSFWPVAIFCLSRWTTLFKRNE